MNVSLLRLLLFKSVVSAPFSIQTYMPIAMDFRITGSVSLRLGTRGSPVQEPIWERVRVPVLLLSMDAPSGHYYSFFMDALAGSFYFLNDLALFRRLGVGPFSSTIVGTTFDIRGVILAIMNRRSDPFAGS